jgi:F0F1-type ATP synthase, delta subunit (mitochondrial oligomycin sensitivity protein)
LSKNKSFSETSATRYSLALYELAKESNQIDEVEKNCSSLIKLIFNSDEFQSLIKNPTIKKDELNSTVLKISDQYKLNSLLIKFLSFLISKRRFFYVEEIFKGLY